ncbi:hypothetical protein [Nocardia africana]
MSETTVTRADVELAANVLYHLNDALAYENTEWWSPRHLREITERVPDAKGKEQIATAIRVVQAMNERFGYDDTCGYAPITVRNWAAELPETGDIDE